MVTWNEHWTTLLIINLKTNQHPHIRGTTFIQHIPYNKDTHIRLQVFTAVTVHIVIFWVVTVCSHVGGNQSFKKHLASIFGKRAGRVRMPLGYIHKLRDRVLWTSSATFPATCLQNINTSSPYSCTQQQWQHVPLEHLQNYMVPPPTWLQSES
jgi:hypothetical protein